MIFISILIIIVAIALPSLKQNLSPILLLRISTIIMIYAGAISLNALYIQSIGSGIGIYSGLFHVTSLTQQLDTFLLIIGSLILGLFNILPLYLANSNIEEFCNFFIFSALDIVLTLKFLDFNVDKSILV